MSDTVLISEQSGISTWKISYLSIISEIKNISRIFIEIHWVMICTVLTEKYYGFPVSRSVSKKNYGAVLGLFLKNSSELKKRRR